MLAPLAHVGTGSWEPLQLLPAALAAGAYALRAPPPPRPLPPPLAGGASARRGRPLSRQRRPVPVARQACFFAGILLIFAALVSPLAHLGGELIAAHIAQHLVPADLAALLIVLGLPGPVLQPILAHRTMQRLRVLFHPAVALPLWALNLYVWHLPALYQAALTSQPVHALQPACFIGFGVCMWMALLGPLPAPSWFGNGARLVYVVAVRLAGALLGNVFIWSGSVFYPDYPPRQAYWNISPLQDQGLARTIMMVEGTS